VVLALDESSGAAAEVAELLSELCTTVLHCIDKPRAENIAGNVLAGKLPQANSENSQGSFAAAIELRLTDRLLQTRHDGDVDLPLLCEKAWKRLHRIVSSLLDELSADGAPTAVNTTLDLQNALRVRSCYHGLRLAVLGPRRRDLNSVRTCLRRSANAIAGVIGGPNFTCLRVSDRRTLRELHAQCVRWFSDAELSEGTVLCDTLQTSLDRLLLVNQRKELRQHDAEVIDRMLRSLSSEDPGQAWAETCLQLQTLKGRSTELDELLSAHLDPHVLVQQATQILSKIASELGADTGQDES
jgi:hypothetical protein